VTTAAPIAPAETHVTTETSIAPTETHVTLSLDRIDRSIDGLIVRCRWPKEDDGQGSRKSREKGGRSRGAGVAMECGGRCNMSMCSKALVCVMPLLIIGCVAEDPTELGVSELDVSELDVSELDVSASVVDDDETDSLLDDSCWAYDGCGGDAIDCYWAFDYECGAEFCRTPGVQCDGQPSTFRHVEHWYYCTNQSTGDFCAQNYIGRYLVHCGC